MLTLLRPHLTMQTVSQFLKGSNAPHHAERRSVIGGPTLTMLCDSATGGLNPSHLPSAVKMRPANVQQRNEKYCGPVMGGR